MLTRLLVVEQPYILHGAGRPSTCSSATSPTSRLRGNTTMTTTTRRKKKARSAGRRCTLPLARWLLQPHRRLPSTPASTPSRPSRPCFTRRPCRRARSTPRHLRQHRSCSNSNCSNSNSRSSCNNLTCRSTQRWRQRRCQQSRRRWASRHSNRSNTRRCLLLFLRRLIC